MTNQRRITLTLAAGFTWVVSATPLLAEESQTSDVSRAEGYAAAAYDAYGRKDYEQAVELYQQAFDAAPSADIIFNLARIHDTKLKDRRSAIDYYRRYTLDTGADPARLRTASVRLSELLELESIASETQVANAAPEPTRATLPPPVESAPPPPRIMAPRNDISGLQIAGIVSGSIAVVGIGLGVGFGFSARSDADTAHELCDGNACRSQRGVDAAEDASRAATLSTAAFVTGGVLAALGLTLIVAGGSDDAQERNVALRPYAHPNGVGTVVSSHF